MRALMIKRFLSILCALALAASPARANFGAGNCLMGFWSGCTDVNFSLAYVTNAVDSVDASTFTFSSQSFGAETCGKRYIVVGLGGGGVAATISSVTIGGITATQILNINTATGIASRGGMFYAEVPTGTTGSVVVTWSTTIARCGIAIWRMVNPITMTPTSSDTQTTTSASVMTFATTTIPTNGGAIGYIYMDDSAATRTWTWTGMTENFDTAIENADNVMHTGSTNT